MHLRQPLRPPPPALAGAYRFGRTHGARVRHARLLCECTDGVYRVNDATEIGQ
jgi:hypothetical protein